MHFTWGHAKCGLFEETSPGQDFPHTDCSSRILMQLTHQHSPPRLHHTVSGGTPPPAAISPISASFGDALPPAPVAQWTEWGACSQPCNGVQTRKCTGDLTQLSCSGQPMQRCNQPGAVCLGMLTLKRFWLLSCLPFFGAYHIECVRIEEIARPAIHAP